MTCHTKAASTWQPLSDPRIRYSSSASDEASIVRRNLMDIASDIISTRGRSATQGGLNHARRQRIEVTQRQNENVDVLWCPSAQPQAEVPTWVGYTRVQSACRKLAKRGRRCFSSVIWSHRLSSIADLCALLNAQEALGCVVGGWNTVTQQWRRHAVNDKMVSVEGFRVISAITKFGLMRWVGKAPRSDSDWFLHFYPARHIRGVYSIGWTLGNDRRHHGRRRLPDQLYVMSYSMGWHNRNVNCDGCLGVRDGIFSFLFYFVRQNCIKNETSQSTE